MSQVMKKFYQLPKKTEISIYPVSYMGLRIMKNCDRGLKMLPEVARRGQHFKGQGHSFIRAHPMLSRSLSYNKNEE